MGGLFVKNIDVVLMRKIGGFYHAFDDDAYILSFLFGYKIKNGKLGFPVSVMSRVKTTLEEHRISYIFKISDEEEDALDFKQDNCYSEYLEKGKENYQKEKLIEKIILKMRELTIEELETFCSYVTNANLNH